MTDNETNSQDEEMIGKLIAAAGPGRSASPEARARVYTAVRARWESELRSGRKTHAAAAHRRPRFNVRVIALAASLGVIAIALSWTELMRAPGVSTAAIAQVALVQGQVELERRDGTEQLIQAGAAPQFIGGDTVRTGADGRVALRRNDGLMLRINADSEVQFADAEQIELLAGTIYIDSGTGISTQTLAIETPFGTVEHLGTQYEARLGEGTLRLRVREGEVSVDNGPDQEIGVAGDELRIGSDGNAIRSRITADDAAWDWAINIATLEPAGDYQVAETLAWIAREMGLTLAYDNPVARQQATMTSLSGLEGQNPRSALAIIQQTTSLSVAIIGDRLTIGE